MIAFDSDRAKAKRAGILSLACTLALAPAPLAAQWGGALGVRIITASSESVRNSERRGYEARVYYDRALAPRLGLRGELAYTQMQFQRDADTVRFQVAENGFELLVSARTAIQHGPFTGAFVSVGPVASFRAACGSHGRFDSNGRVVCDEGETFLVGYALGAGYHWPSSGRNDFTLEMRFVGHVTAAAGGQVLAISFGLRRR
jgi:hypothetical protein